MADIQNGTITIKGIDELEKKLTQMRTEDPTFEKRLRGAICEILKEARKELSGDAKENLQMQRCPSVQGRVYLEIYRLICLFQNYILSLQHETIKQANMKKILYLLLILTACSSHRNNGIYQSENGWDIVEDEKTYQYRCELDGLYLYIDWDGANSYSIEFFHEDKETTFARLQFLCKNKDGKYVYVANYYELNIRFYNLKEIGFDIGDGRMVIHKYRQNKDCFSLLEKYTAQ